MSTPDNTTSQFTKYVESVFTYFGIPLNLRNLLILTGTLFLLKFVFQGFSDIYKSYAINRYMRNCQSTVFDQVLRSKWSHQLNLSSWFIIDDLIKQIDETKVLYTRIIRTVKRYTTVLVYSIVCLFISVPVTLLGLVSAGIVAFIYVPLLRISKGYGLNTIDAQQKFSDLNTQFIKGFKEIKMYNAEGSVSSKVHEQAFNIFKYKFYNEMLSRIIRTITQGSAGLFICAWAWNILAGILLK